MEQAPVWHFRAQARRIASRLCPHFPTDQGRAYQHRHHHPPHMACEAPGGLVNTDALGSARSPFDLNGRTP